MYANIPRIPAVFSRQISKYGDPITVYRASGNLSINGMWVKGRQLLSPFDINFLRFMMFATDSGVVRGDHIKDTSTGEEFFIVATQQDTAITAPMSIYTELYMINYTSVDVQRYQPGTVDQYGNSAPATWSDLGTVPMVVEHVNGNIPYKDGLLLSDTVFRLTMQTTTALQIAPNPDRVIIDGKPYEVSDINLSEAPNLQIVQVKQDMR